MALYHYRCTCGNEIEIRRSMAERNNPLTCVCGENMERVLEVPAPAIFPVNGKGKVLQTLNRENNRRIPASRPSDVNRIEQALARGLDNTRPVIGVGYG